MNILIVGPADAKADNPRELTASYLEVITSGLPAESILSFKTAVLDDFLIEITQESLSVYDTFNNVPLTEYDAVFFRGHGFSHLVDVMGVLTEYAKKHSITLWNEYPVIRDSSKLLQNAHMFLNGMPIPRTLYVNRSTVTTRPESWQFPSIMKMVNGSLGRFNYVVHSWEEVEKINNDNGMKRFILQQFIPNDGDYRLLIAGENILIFKRTSDGLSHMNNTSQGASAAVVDESDIPSEIIDQARLIAKQYGMTFAGVDVMQDKETGKYYFLEVNMQPQLTTGALLKEKQALLVDFFSGLQK